MYTEPAPYELTEFANVVSSIVTVIRFVLSEFLKVVYTSAASVVASLKLNVH